MYLTFSVTVGCLELLKRQVARKIQITKSYLEFMVVVDIAILPTGIMIQYVL